MPAIEKQRLALFGVAQRGMAAFVDAVIRFGFDNARTEPQAVDPVADDLAQEFAGNTLSISVEKGIRQHVWHLQGYHISG